MGQHRLNNCRNQPNSLGSAFALLVLGQQLRSDIKQRWLCPLVRVPVCFLSFSVNNGQGRSWNGEKSLIMAQSWGEQTLTSLSCPRLHFFYTIVRASTWTVNRSVNLRVIPRDAWLGLRGKLSSHCKYVTGWVHGTEQHVHGTEHSV